MIWVSGKARARSNGLLHLRIVNLQVERQAESAQERKAATPITFATDIGPVEIGLHGIRVIVQGLADTSKVGKGEMPFQDVPYVWRGEIGIANDTVRKAMGVGQTLKPFRLTYGVVRIEPDVEVHGFDDVPVRHGRTRPTDSRR
jgi:hypothetical protein